MPIKTYDSCGSCAIILIPNTNRQLWHLTLTLILTLTLTLTRNLRAT